MVKNTRILLCSAFHSRLSAATQAVLTLAPTTGLPQKNDDQSKVAFRGFRGKVNGQLDIYADVAKPPEKIVDMGLQG